VPPVGGLRISCVAVAGGEEMNEAEVRDALPTHLLAAIVGAEVTVDEFWVPRSNERADIAVLGRQMDGFEIKTHRDTLRRIP
jgi:hypothetical protein